MPGPQDEQHRFNGIFTAGNDLLQQINIAVIRLDGKMDKLDQRFGDFRDAVNNKFKDIEAIQKDQETRLRFLQDRPYVSPATVWKVVGTLISVMGLAATIYAMVKK